MKIITTSAISLAIGAVLSSCTNHENLVHGTMGAFSRVNQPVYVLTSSLEDDVRLAPVEAAPAPVQIVAQPPVISQPIALRMPSQKAVVVQAPKQAVVRIAASPKPVVVYQAPAKRNYVIQRSGETVSPVLRKKRAYPVMPGRGR